MIALDYVNMTYIPWIVQALTSTIAAAIQTIILTNAINNIMAMARRGIFLIHGKRLCWRSALWMSGLKLHLRSLSMRPLSTLCASEFILCKQSTLCHWIRNSPSVSPCGSTPEMSYHYWLVLDEGLISNRDVNFLEDRRRSQLLYCRLQP